MSGTTSQTLVAYSAGCLDCDAQCGTRNAIAWAHNHARKHKHKVELVTGFVVSPK